MRYEFCRHNELFLDQYWAEDSLHMLEVTLLKEVECH
jgi:hypothetical protein